MSTQCTQNALLVTTSNCQLITFTTHYFESDLCDSWDILDSLHYNDFLLKSITFQFTNITKFMLHCVFYNWLVLSGIIWFKKQIYRFLLIWSSWSSTNFNGLATHDNYHLNYCHFYKLSNINLKSVNIQLHVVSLGKAWRFLLLSTSRNLISGTDECTIWLQADAYMETSQIHRCLSCQLTKHWTTINKQMYKHNSMNHKRVAHTVSWKCPCAPLPILQSAEMPSTAANICNSVYI